MEYAGENPIYIGVHYGEVQVVRETQYGPSAILAKSGNSQEVTQITRHFVTVCSDQVVSHPLEGYGSLPLEPDSREDVGQFVFIGVVDCPEGGVHVKEGLV